MAKQKIKDTGEFIPGAHKHREKTSLALSDIEPAKVTLKDAWPEPNWLEYHKNGYSIETLVTFYCTYKNIRNRPLTTREAYRFPTIGQSQWADWWLKGVNLLKEYFETQCGSPSVCISREDLSQLLVTRMTVAGSIEQFRELPFDDCLPAWASGRGGGYSFRLATSLKFEQQIQADILKHYGWPFDALAKRYSVLPYHHEKSGSYELLQVSGRTYRRLKDEPRYENLNDACERGIELSIEKLKDKKSLKKELGYQPKKDRSELVTDSIKLLNRDISPNDFIETFEFRGIQFGESLGEREKQDWLNNVCMALVDLGTLLDIDVSAYGLLGLDGAGMAFASRGIPGSAAHYEPGLHVINLTRNQGPGSLAHEFFHSFEATLIKTLFPDVLSRAMNGQLPSQQLPTVKGYYSTFTQPQRDIVDALYSLVNKLSSGTQFKNQAVKLSSQNGAKRNYWHTNCELLARAFEAYCQDKIISKNIRSDWLVTGTLPTDTPEQYRAMCPYPTDNERIKFVSAFDAFFSVVIPPLQEHFMFEE